MMLNRPKTTTSNVILTIAVFIVFNVLLPIDYCHHHHVLVMAKKSSHKGVTKRGDKNEGHHGSSPSSGGKTNKAAGGAIPTRFEDLTSRSDITPTKRSSSSYVGCTLCGEGVEMLNPDGIVTTGQDQTVTCAQLEANSVHLPSDGIACQKLQELTFVTCQCRGWDSVQRTTDSTGAFVAEDSDIAGELVSTNVSTNSTNSTEFVCEVCRGGGVIGNPNGLVMDTTTGVPTFCSVLHENRMNISETACPRIQAFAFAACECSIPPEQNITADVNLGVEESGSEVGELYSCPVCGPDGVIGNPNGLVTNARGQTARCSLLEANQGSVPPNACSTLQELAREPCDCLSAPLVGTEESESTSNPAVCSICGEGIITIPEGIVTNTQGREARCDVMQANAASIPDDLCESIQAMARTSCGCARIVNNDPQNIGQNQTSGNEVINVNSTTNELDVGNSTSTTLTCPICGNGVMNNPDGIVVTRQGQAARCTVLNANANTIPESACPTIQALSNIPCGCAESDEQLNGTNGKEAGDEQEIFVCKVCGDNQSIRDPNRRIVTSLGVYTCSNAYAAGLIGGIPEDHCDSLRISVAEECGCVADGPTEAPTAEPYMCSICSDGRVVTTADGRMDVSLAALGGASGLTCGQYEIAASRGQIAEDECAAIQSLSESPCGCKLPEFSPTPAPTGFVCPICGEGMVVGYPDGEVILPNTQRMSCGGLQMRAEMNIIQPTQCAQIQPFVRESCKCVVESFPDPTYAPTQYECNICGEGRAVTDSNGIVVIPTQPDRTCGELMAAAEFGYITPNQCSLLNPFTQSPCKCITVDTTVPSDMPSSPPTGPTVSPAPTTIMEREDCYASLSEIYELERVIADTSTQRKYVLCPRRTFHMGIWTEDGRGIKDGEQFIALRPNVIYQCGEDGSRNNNCILKGGDFGLASYYGVYSGIYESVENVEIRGLTFESQNLFSAVLKSAGDISFIGCAFKVRQMYSSALTIHLFSAFQTLTLIVYFLQPCCAGKHKQRPRSNSMGGRRT
jgi:hypothetical protein